VNEKIPVLHGNGSPAFRREPAVRAQQIVTGSKRRLPRGGFFSRNQEVQHAGEAKYEKEYHD
jgi:hypothetical protein